MVKVAMLALGASLTFSALAPNDVAAQSGRQRSQGRTDDIRVERRDSRVNDRVNQRCFDDDDVRFDRNGRRIDDRDSDRYKNKDKHKGKNKGHRADDRWDDDDCRDIYSTTSSRKKGNGPPFCRNGQGHPVHGMQWCRDKGWDRDGFSLRNTGWEDVILRRRGDAQRDLGRGTLQDILGSVVLGRFDRQRSSLGLGAPLIGRWQETSNGTLLDLFSGGVQVAQILDRNRDGRADVVLVNYGSRR